MAKESGLGATVSVDDSGGTLRDISNDVTDFTINTPLRQGESVTHEGWKITNVESGEFGDVVKVEKVG